jgi:hypothetical protein
MRVVGHGNFTDGEEFLHERRKMIEEEEDFDFNEIQEEPQVKRFTGTDLVRWLAILFVFVVYFYIFLKIMFLS